MSLSPITVIGAGAWGTALAILMANNGQAVRLWDRDAERVKQLQTARENQRYLPGVKFPNALTIYADMATACENVNDIMIVVPSHAFTEVLTGLKPFMHSASRLVWATKGVDPNTHKLLHIIAEAILGKPIPLAVIAGPNFAKEIAMGLPAAIALAHTNDDFASDLTARLHNSQFRVYTTHDMIGVQICGAVKNILAIAVGINDGLKMGANARCALITRGLAEMTRLGMAMGGKRETFMGLAGVGDLVLTATDDQSRNRRFGLALGQGKDIELAKQEIGLVEGASNVTQVSLLAKQFHVEMPITEQIQRIIYQDISPRDAMQALLTRELKAENL